MTFGVANRAIREKVKNKKLYVEPTWKYYSNTATVLKSGQQITKNFGKRLKSFFPHNIFILKIIHLRRIPGSLINMASLI